MGYYINENSKGKFLGDRMKASSLIADGAKIVEAKFQPNLICVVDNHGMFDAAAYCYSEEEFEVFNDPRDNRPKVWLTHPLAVSLSGYEK